MGLGLRLEPDLPLPGWERAEAPAGPEAEKQAVTLWVRVAK